MTKKIVLPLVLLTLAGCFTARTGELYQETKAARIEAWWALWESEYEFSFWAIFTVPVKMVFQGVDIAFLNPVWDTFMLPYDLAHFEYGKSIRILDGAGKPIPGATVEVEGSYRADKWVDYTLSNTVHDSGVTDEEGYVSIPRKNTHYEFFDCLVSAHGYHSRRAVIHLSRAAFAPTTNALGRAAIEIRLDKVRDPIDHPVRPFDIPFAWTYGEQEWVRGYDLAKGAWMPPFGSGECSDIEVMFTSSKEKGTKRILLQPGDSTASFARHPVKPFADPRFFVIDYEVPDGLDFSTEACLLVEGEDEKPENALDWEKDYLIYRVRREDGVHVGALVPTRLGTRMRNVYNPKPGSLSLEYHE